MLPKGVRALLQDRTWKCALSQYSRQSQTLKKDNDVMMSFFNVSKGGGQSMRAPETVGNRGRHPTDNPLQLRPLEFSYDRPQPRRTWPNLGKPIFLCFEGFSLKLFQNWSDEKLGPPSERAWKVIRESCFQIFAQPSGRGRMDPFGRFQNDGFSQKTDILRLSEGALPDGWAKIWNQLSRNTFQALSDGGPNFLIGSIFKKF